jgi:hypothetical protein
MTSSDHRDLEAQIEELEAEERELSQRRRRLHDRIALYPDRSGHAETEERELSRQRHELHRRIDELRALRDGPGSDRPRGGA